jgi:hypothetical protein
MVQVNLQQQNNSPYKVWLVAFQLNFEGADSKMALSQRALSKPNNGT